MRSKTSYFNKGVFFNNIKRFWLVAFSYSFLLFLYMIGYLNSVSVRLNRDFFIEPVQIAASIFTQSSEVMIFLLGLFCLISALAVFSYMHFPRNTAMIHALPLKRETLYVTNYLSGLLLVTFPLVFNGTIMIVSQAVMGVPLNYGFQWLGVNFVLTFLLYSFAVFAGMFTGHMAAQVFYYLIFNFLAVFLERMITIVLDDFLFGYYTTTAKFNALSPLYHIVGLFGSFYSNEGNTGTIAGYFIAGAFFTVTAMLLYKRRHMEVATDVISFGIVKPIFKYSATFCSSALLGAIIVTILNLGRNYTGYVIAYLTGGFIGYFVCEMLLRKSFRVFRAYKGFVVYGLILGLLFCSIGFDIYGYESYVPEESEIEIMYIYEYHDLRRDLALEPDKYDPSEHRYLLSTKYYYESPPEVLDDDIIEELRNLPGVITSKEAIIKARRIHQYIAANSRQFEINQSNYSNNEQDYKIRSLYFRYKLKNGAIIERYYQGLVTHKDDTELDNLLREYFSLPDIIVKYEPLISKSAGDILTISVGYYTEEGAYIRKEVEDIEGFLEAYKKDIMNVGPNLSVEGPYGPKFPFEVSIEFKDMDPNSEISYYQPAITPEHRNVIEFLTENKIIDIEKISTESGMKLKPFFVR